MAPWSVVVDGAIYYVYGSHNVSDLHLFLLHLPVLTGCRAYYSTFIVCVVPSEEFLSSSHLFFFSLRRRSSSMRSLKVWALYELVLLVSTGPLFAAAQEDAQDDVASQEQQPPAADELVVPADWLTRPIQHKPALDGFPAAIFYHDGSSATSRANVMAVSDVFNISSATTLYPIYAPTSASGGPLPTALLTATQPLVVTPYASPSPSSPPPTNPSAEASSGVPSMPSAGPSRPPPASSSANPRIAPGYHASAIYVASLAVLASTFSTCWML